MTTIVVDASVAIKWFLPEENAVQANALLDDRYERIAPDLLWFEFANVLWKMVRRGQLTRARADRIREELEAVKIVNVPTVDLTPALHLAYTLDRTVYDSVYLALAIKRDCQLVTADLKLFRAVTASEWARHVSYVDAP